MGGVDLWEEEDEMAMLKGKYELEILKMCRKGSKNSRYIAKFASGTNHKVTVKFKNGGPSPIGRIGDFDGDENDIRDAGDSIDQHRKNKSFHNPFI
jgi:hypothetical protein